MFKAVKIGKHEVFPGAIPLFLPDIGTFFNKDMSVATRMVDELLNAGVSVVKGEILHTSEVCLRNSGDEIFWGHVSRSERRENYRALIERKTVPLFLYEKLFVRCLESGMDVVVSVYDFEGASFAATLGLSAIKIASSNITHQPLIQHIAGLGLPVIIDTGHSTLEEIGRAINWARDAGVKELVVQHSPLAPPNGLEAHNLRFIKTLETAFGIPSGLSDHHYGDEMLYAATALGASIIEKGVRPDDLGDDQDAAHALPISKVSAVLCKIRNVHVALGDGVRHLPRERDKYRSRMGLVAKRDLSVGDLISLDNVTFAFPPRGIMVEHWPELVGWRLVTSIKAGDIIRWQDVSAAPG